MPLDLWELLESHMRLYRSFMAGVEVQLRGLNIDTKEFLLLRALEDHRFSADLARYLQLPKPTITFMTKRLEAKGYVRRKAIAGDLRKSEITLTAAGAKAYRAGRKIMMESSQGRLARISNAELKTYLAVLQKLI